MHIQDIKFGLKNQGAVLSHCEGKKKKLFYSVILGDAIDSCGKKRKKMN